MEMQNVKAADKVMSIITIILFIPLAVVPFVNQAPDVVDVLTYFSFFLSVLSALYVGRGVFSIGEGVDEGSSKKQEAHARSSFIISIFFIFGAALMLIPVIFKKVHGVLPFSGIAFVVAFLVAGAVCVRIDHKKEGWRSPHLIMPLLPIIVLIVAVVAFACRYASVLSKIST